MPVSARRALIRRELKNLVHFTFLSYSSFFIQITHTLRGKKRKKYGNINDKKRNFLIAI